MATHSSILAWRIPSTEEPGAMAPHSSTLAWKIPWTEEPGRLQSMGLLGVAHDWELHFHFSLSCIGGGNGNPLQCSCLENPRGGAWWVAISGVAQSRTRLKWLSSSRSLVGYSPCGRKESDMTEWLTLLLSYAYKLIYLCLLSKFWLLSVLSPLLQNTYILKPVNNWSLVIFLE